MKKLSEILELRTIRLETLIDELVGQCTAVPAQVTLDSLEEQGDILIQLDNLKKMMKGGLKCINKALTKSEDHLCRTIADECDEIPYHHPRATLSPSARGFFTISDAAVFLDSLNGDLEEFVQLTASSKQLQEHCERFLERGERLPKGVKGHIQAKVAIRRKTKDV